MCCSAPSPPDMSPMADASMETAKLARETAVEQLAFAKEKWTQQQDMLDQVLAVQMPMMNDQFINARKDRARYEQVFQGLEDKLVQDAVSYDSQARREAEAGQAVADVTTAYDAQRENASRSLQSYGIDPSQIHAQALDATMRSQEAAAQAGAANMARRNTEATGRGLRAEAINIGKGMPGQSLASYQGASGAGNSAVNNTNSTISSGVNNMSAGYTGMSTALQGYNNAANITNQGYQNTLSQYNSGFSLGDAAGLVGGATTSYLTGGIMKAEGGPIDIERMTGGVALPAPPLPTPDGAVVGPGGPRQDAIPARLSNGEFVIDAETMKWKGQEFFEKTIQKAQQDKAEATALRQQKQGVPTVSPQGNPSAIPMGAR